MERPSRSLVNMAEVAGSIVSSFTFASRTPLLVRHCTLSPFRLRRASVHSRLRPAMRSRVTSVCISSDSCRMTGPGATNAAA